MMPCDEAQRRGICKGDCCGVIGFRKEFLDTHTHLQQRPYDELIEFRGEFYPTTGDMKCIFLDSKNKCAIYNKRPDVCRDYGHSLEQPCPHIDFKGRIRSPAKRKRWQRIINHQVDDRLKKMKKIGGIR